VHINRHRLAFATMKFPLVSVFALIVSSTDGFLSTHTKKHGVTWGLSRMTNSVERNRCAGLKASLSDEDKGTAERMSEILKEESSNPANMAASAEQMKNMTPDDMDKMIAEMDQMGPLQEASLKAMGMDPTLMKKSMKMMRDNPAMMESAKKMMEGMTPDQMIAQSRLAQEQMAAMSPDQVEQATKAMEELSSDQLEAAAEIIKEKGMPGSAGDPMVIETMYRAAELMSRPPTGGVTLQGFKTLPPITVLSGNRDEDLSPRELAECWADGALGATRVDRSGFERVWNEVREYFEGDIMDEARKTASKKKIRSSEPESKATEVVASPVSVSPPGSSSTASSSVGANLSPEQMRAVNDQVKNMSDDDMGSMLDAMSEMSPAQEARMKEMGVDPTMMKRAGEMMKNNPMARKAAQAMMKNMSPEQMLKMSQQAQQQMANMSPEDYEKAMERMKKGQ